ncbi:MAG: phosphate acyltransferase PlsX [Chloroflexota bacterium]
MNIALDVMGGDYAPHEIVAGAVQAAREFEISLTLVGIPDTIEQELKKYDTHGLELPIVPASEVITMDDKPGKVIRSKPDNSMSVACRLVKEGHSQGFVTAGNTGGALTSGILHIGRIKGIMRPALITPYPTLKGACTVLDVGANADTRPEHMQQFAIMGSIYAEHVFDIDRPTVCLLSNGEEEGKGNQLVVSAYELLQKTPNIRFEGNIESKEVTQGIADVVVTDGFTGNIFVKTTEATARMLMTVMFEELTKGPINKAGALLARSGIRKARERLDDSPYGGAVLLGLSGVVVVAHGRSDANGIRHVIRIAKHAIEQNLTQKISDGMKVLAEAMRGDDASPDKQSSSHEQETQDASSQGATTQVTSAQTTTAQTTQQEKVNPQV